MPRYTYRCNECEEEFEKTHSIKEKLKDCDLCETKGSLIRVPSGFTTVYKTQQTRRKPGSLVKEFIEDAKEDLKEQKNELEQGR